jgi:hypothetical protein
MSGVGLFARPGVYLILGRHGAPKQYVAYRIWTSCCSEQFRGPFANAGDVNGDGVDDIILGEPSVGFPNGKGLFGIYSGDTTVVLSVSEMPGSQPSEFNLSQNYPNPFNSSTIIAYSVPKKSFVTLKVYGILGQEMQELYAGERETGLYRITFNADKLSSGEYYYRVTGRPLDGSPSTTQTKTMTLVK